MQRNSIHKGDCIELMALIPDKSIDMILCDLPYGTTACKWDTIIPFADLWIAYERIIKDNGAIVLTASQPFTSALVMSNPKLFKCEWIWEKNRGSNFASTKFQPMKEHESVLIFSKGTTVYNPIREERGEGGKARAIYVINPSNTGKREAYNGIIEKETRTLDKNLRCPRSVQKFNTEVGLHPTQKPITLFKYFIETYTNKGDLVLDNCAGSGTTAIACMEVGRDFIVMEQDDKYYRTIIDRINDTLVI